MSILQRRLTLMMAVCLFPLNGQTALAGIIQLGGTYTVNGVNFVTNYTQNVTVDPLPHLVDSGQLLLTLTTFPTGPNSEWDEFTFTTTTGGPLASDLNGFWQLNLRNLPLSKSAFWDGAFIYWSVDGKAVDPIFPFGGIDRVSPNPINPALGPVYGGLFSPPFGPVTTLDLPNFVFVSPYSFVSSGGIDPNKANDFHAAIHLTLATVPEPSSVALLATGSLCLLGWIWRRRRRMAW